MLPFALEVVARKPEMGWEHRQLSPNSTQAGQPLYQEIKTLRVISALAHMAIELTIGDMPPVGNGFPAG